MVAIDSESCQTSFQSFCAPPSEVTVLFDSNLSRPLQTPLPRTGHISFAPYLAANLGCDRFRIMPDIMSKLLCAAIWSWCVVWFESEQTPFPRTGSRLRSAALHRILFGTCCFVPMSYFYSGTNEWSQDWVKLCCFGQQQLLANSIGISFPNEKNSVVTAWYLQSIKTFLTVKLSQYSKSGSTFSSSEQVAASSDWLRPAPQETPFVCARPSYPRKQSWSAAPTAWPLILQSNPSIVFSNSLREWLPDDRHC